MNAYLPTAGKQDVRAKVISVLAEKFPLTAKEVYKKIKDALPANQAPSYQAVHKAILQLTGFEVIERKETAYALNKVWATHLRQFGEKIEQAILGAPPSIESLKEGESVLVSFDGAFIKPYYWLLGQVALLSSSKLPVLPTVCHHYHAWPISVITEKEHEQLKTITRKRGHFVLCKGNTRLDKFMLNLWDDLGGKWKSGHDCSQNCDLIVAQDFVFQIFQTEDTKRKWKTAYSKAKKSSEINLQKLHKLLFETKAKTNVIITRNAQMADEIRNKTISHFK